MAKNTLGLVSASLRRLDVDDAVLLGPYRSATTVAGKIARLRKCNPAFASREFVQRQMLLVDAKSAVVYRMFLVTRVA